jgi:predicted RNA-binding Zn-ribbon protein involved in translation (DUF1610 family)
MCSREIALVGELRLPEEFSVLCPNCGRRKVYRSAAVHDQTQDAEATSRTIVLRPFQ